MLAGNCLIEMIPDRDSSVTKNLCRYESWKLEYDVLDVSSFKITSFILFLPLMEKEPTNFYTVIYSNWNEF